MYINQWWWWWFSYQVMSDSCDPMDCTGQASLSMGFPRQKILERVAISFSRGSF